jgi:hypothetical protein
LLAIRWCFRATARANRFGQKCQNRLKSAFLRCDSRGEVQGSATETAKKRMECGFLAGSADLRSTLFQGMTGIHHGAAVGKARQKLLLADGSLNLTRRQLLKGKANGPQGNEEKDGA